MHPVGDSKMCLTELFFICIALSSMEASNLPRAYRHGGRQKSRLYPIEMRDPDQPLDNYGWRKFGYDGKLKNDRHLFGDKESAHVTRPSKNNMVLDIVSDMAKNLKYINKRTHKIEDSFDNLRTHDSIENSKENKNLFGSNGYVHLTYPSKQKNNLLGDIVGQMAKNLRMLEQGREEPASLENNIRSFDTIIHFEENPENDKELYADAGFVDLSNPSKNSLLMKIVEQLGKGGMRGEFEGQDEQLQQAESSAVTPKLVYKFNELVI